MCLGRRSRSSPRRLRRGQKCALQRPNFTNPQTGVIREITSSVIHYFVCQSSPLVSAPNEIMQVHNLTFCFYSVCFNTVLSSTPKFSEFSLSSFFNLFLYAFSFLPNRASTSSYGSLSLSPSHFLSS